MEEGSVEERQRTTQRNWKRILLFTVLIFILVGSLLYYFLPSVTHPLRIDSVPVDAYVVPWMRPNPSIEKLGDQLPNGPLPFDIEPVMVGALELDITFMIDTPNGTRAIPSTVYLGHDSKYLYVGGKFRGMYTNPLSGIPKNHMEPNVLGILFDVDNDGVLTIPESGTNLATYVLDDGVHFIVYIDMLWYPILEESREGWATNWYYSPMTKESVPASSGPFKAEYDNSTGTVTILFSRLLWVPNASKGNALQMRPGERWAMGFLLELGYERASSLYGGYVDEWPQKAYPYLSNDASWWPKLVIDLANPPANM